MSDQHALGVVGPGRRSSGPQRLFLLAVTLVAFCLVLGSGARAADAVEETAANDDAIEEIVVLGTRIKRRDFVTASPLTTIDSELIEFSGQATLEETLNQMPQVTPRSGRASNYTDSRAGFGAAEVDLRGIGPGRSLVLINGRRMAPSGIGNSVDLNNIPLFLVERVEIISGGASAVYGSDAIGGIVNVITKQDFSGIGIEAGMMMAEPGDAETYDFNLALGHNFTNGRGNVSFYANGLERKTLYASDRNHTNITWTDNWYTGTLEPDGSFFVPAGIIGFPPVDFGNGPEATTFDPDGTPRAFVGPDDLYNFAQENYLQVPLTRTAVGLLGHYALTDRIEAYVEASYSRNETELNMAAIPAVFPAQVNLDNPVLTPEARQHFADNYVCAPNLTCIYLGRRLVELGHRLKQLERDHYRLVAGARGELWDGWDLDAWVTYTTESSDVHLRNDASTERLLQGLLVDPATNECYDPSGGCVPLNLFGEGNLSQVGADFVRFPAYENTTDRTQTLASLFVTGSPIDTWAGPLDVAIGAAWRRDDIDHDIDEVLLAGDALGFSSTSPVDGAEEVWELYSEAVIPLASNRRWVDYLGLEIGVRYSDYQLAGSSWTYKAGSTWQLSDALMLRAMHQRSVRAPNSVELFELQTESETTFAYWGADDDPCSASADPIGNDYLEKCVIQGLPADQVGVFEATQFYPATSLSGGNPDLEPEDGRTWTVGAVFSPTFLPDWVFSVDYFDIDISDTIGPVSVKTVCFDPGNTAHAFCENMQRDSTGNVVEITELTRNRGLVETTGIDTQIQYASELSGIPGFGDRAADIGISIYWTHVLTNRIQASPGTPIIDCAGLFGPPCAFRAATYPENRVTSNIHYASGPLRLNLAWRWIEGTENAGQYYGSVFGFEDPNIAVLSIGNENYLDLGVAYSFGDILSARLGIDNLLDNDPPLMANFAHHNTDPGLYDVFGRSYYLTLSAQF